MSPNADAIKTIAYAWGLAFAPHALKITLLGNAGYKWDNRIGRANMSKDASRMKISPDALARCQRADAAHQNGMESLPLFGLAVLAAVQAGVDSGDVDKWTKIYLALRLVYNIIYIVGGGQGVALTRTLIWGSSVFSSINLLLKASRLLAAKGL